MANNEKMNISYAIRAIDSFSKTHRKVHRELNNLQARLAAFDAKSNLDEIDIRVNVDDALNEVAALKAVISSIKDRKINAEVIGKAKTKKAEVEVNKLKRAVDSVDRVIMIRATVQGFKKGVNFSTKLATGLRTVEEITEGFGRGLLATSVPMITTALGVVAAGAGALVTQVLGAGAALGGFALVAVPTINYLKEVNENVERGSAEWYALSDATKSTLNEFQELSKTFNWIQGQFREPTLEIFTSALNSADMMLKMFIPTIDSAVGAVDTLAQKLADNLGSEDVKAIFEWLGSTAGGYLDDLVSTLGNFLVGIMNMAVAFDPLAQDFSDGFLSMSESFREWTSNLENNQAFQNFIEYAQTHGPQLLETIGAITTFLIDLGKALAPVGEAMLPIVTGFLNWAGAMLEAHPWIGKLLAGMVVLKGVISMVIPVVSILFTAFSTLVPILARLVTGFLRVVVPIVKVGIQIGRLSTPIGWAITAIVTLVTAVIVYWDEISALTKKFVAKFKGYFEKIDLLAVGKRIIDGLVRGISNGYEKVKQKAYELASKLPEWMQKVLGIKSPSRVMAKTVGRWIPLGVTKGMTDVQSKAQREATAVATAISKPFEQMNKDYAFTTSVGAARQSYSDAVTQRSAAPIGTAIADRQSQRSQEQYAVLNIGGHEARGVIKYVSREQDRDAHRKTQFKPTT